MEGTCAMRGKPAKVGDTKISPNGYHYTRTPNGWELTGRYLAAKRLGRALKNTERVKFLDGDQLNLDPDNIEVREVKTSPGAKRARLEARIEELQAQLAELEEASN
jgi:hypothetical protein